MRINGLHHVLLTVRDASRSADFYTKLLGLHVLQEVPDDAGEVVKVICGLPDGRLLGFVRHEPAGEADEFNELRTGLDHLAFSVPVEELEDWSARLATAGVPHTPPAPSAFGAPLIVFRDPDNIQLQVYGTTGN